MPSLSSMTRVKNESNLLRMSWVPSVDMKVAAIFDSVVLETTDISVSEDERQLGLSGSISRWFAFPRLSDWRLTGRDFPSARIEDMMEDRLLRLSSSRPCYQSRWFLCSSRAKLRLDTKPIKCVKSDILSCCLAASSAVKLLPSCSE